MQRPEEQQADSGACPAHSSLVVPCLGVHPLCAGLLEGGILTVLTFPGSRFWDLPAHTSQSLFLHSPPSPSPAVLPMFLLTNSLLLCFPSSRGSPPFLFASPGSLVTLPCHPSSSLPIRICSAGDQSQRDVFSSAAAITQNSISPDLK